MVYILQDEDEEDEENEEGGLSKSGKELKKLLGRAGGLNDSDAEEEDDDDDEDVSFADANCITFLVRHDFMIDVSCSALVICFYFCLLYKVQFCRECSICFLDMQSYVMPGFALLFKAGGYLLFLIMF